MCFKSQLLKEFAQATHMQSKFMTWTSECKTFSVSFEKNLLKKLVDYITNSFINETGGVIVGRYSEDRTTALISDFLPPPQDSQMYRNVFVRGVKGLTNVLSKLWIGKERRYYLGEWHYHPSKYLIPSKTDLEQMIAINHEPRFQCKEPIMIIVGKFVEDNLPIIVMVFKESKTYQLKQISYNCSDNLFDCRKS